MTIKPVEFSICGLGIVDYTQPPKLKRGWLKRQVKAAKKDIKKWPKWMKEAAHD